MNKVYLSLGTNLGNKEANLKNAIKKIERRIGPIEGQSAFLETEPWGFVSENTFLNAAVIVRTELPPTDVLNITKQIERDMGRASKSINGVYKDRIIDIDILMYDDLIMHNEVLDLPHPMMHKRQFVMIPLAEIAHDVIIPGLDKRVCEFLSPSLPSRKERNS